MNPKTVEEVAFNLIKDAAIRLPVDIKLGLKRAYKLESNTTAKRQLKIILDNVDLAEEQQVPICQDTGTVTFYINVGPQTKNLATVEKALNNATRRATFDVPLRPNAVDPFAETNSGNNTGRFAPNLHWETMEGDGLELTVLLKGGGSENVSSLRMFNPSDGAKEFKKFVIDSVISAGAQPCPPTILGVAVGGGADVSVELAKKALLRPLGTPNSESRIAVLEQELLEAVNMTGIGPMGLGGDTTSLAVHIDHAYRHPASFPVAIVFGCWANRRASAQINSDGKIKYLSKNAKE